MFRAVEPLSRMTPCSVAVHVVEEDVIVVATGTVWPAVAVGLLDDLLGDVVVLKVVDAVD